MFIMFPLVGRMKQLIINVVREEIFFSMFANEYRIDSQYTNSESEEELINSEAHSTSDFQKDLDFGKRRDECRICDVMY